MSTLAFLSLRGRATLRAPLILAGSFALLVADCFATSNPATWTGGSATSDNWGDTANWSGVNGNPDGAGITIIHFAGISRLTPFNNYGTFTQFNQVLFDSGAGSFTLNGAVIKLAPNGGSVAKVENNSANAQTVSFNTGGSTIIFTTTAQLNPTMGDLTINNAMYVDGSGTQVIHVFGNGGHVLTINGSLNNGAATAALTNETNNIVVLNGSNGYTGNTTIKGGELRFGQTGSANSSAILLGDTTGGQNAKLTLSGTGQSLGNFLTVQSGNSGTMTFQSANTSGTNSWTGTITLNKGLTVAASAGGTLSLNTIAGNSNTLTASGAGTVMLTGTADNNSLAVAVDAGTVVLAKTNSGPGGTGAGVRAVGTGLTIGGGTAQLAGTGGDQIYDLANVAVTSGSFDVNGRSETFQNLSLAGTGIGGTGALINSASGGATITPTGGTTLTADTVIGVTQTGATLTLNNAIGGGFGLEKVGSGKLTVTGASTFFGITKVSGGTLEAAAGSALGGTSDVTINTGGTLLLSNTGTTNRINDSATITMSGGTIAISGNVTEGSSPGTGALTLTTSSTIDFANGNGRLNFGDSSGATWTGTLSIYNYDAGNDHLLFGSSNTSLTSSQLNQISFFSGSGSGFLGTGAFIGSGEVSPIPEPSSVAVAATLLGLVAWRERRRDLLQRRATRVSGAC